MLKQMIELRRLAAHAHCRITKWKLTEDQAYALADEVGEATGFSRLEIVEQIRLGTPMLFGARATLRAA